MPLLLKRRVAASLSLLSKVAALVTDSLTNGMAGLIRKAWLTVVRAAVTGKKSVG